jgi:hypothetical protein
MRTVLKIFVIGFGFLLLVIPFGVLKSLNSFTSGVSGIIGFALLVGFIAGARAIWKYNPEKKTTDDRQLDKK